MAPTAGRQRPAPTQPPRKPAGPGLSDGAIGGNPAAAPRGGGARGPRSGKSWERGGGRDLAVRGSTGRPGGSTAEGNIHLSRLAGGHRVQGQPVRDFKGMANPHRLHDMVI